MPQELEDLETKWDALGKEDAMWAVLTHPEKAGGRWDPAEFFATGVAEIDATFADLGRLGLAVTPGTALDFGCGVGRLSQALAARFERVIGMDVAPSMIALARRHDHSAGNVTYRINESTRLEGVPDDSVDFIYSNIVLQHIPPPISLGYVREFTRVLRRGGIGFFQIPARPRSPVGHVKGLLKRHVPALATVLNAAYRGRRTATMDMYGLPRPSVERTIRDGGCTVLAVLDDGYAGPGWESFRYVITKT